MDLPRSKTSCLGVDLVGVAVDSRGKEEREFEEAPISPLRRPVLRDRPLADSTAAGEVIPLSRSCNESDNSSSV